MTIHNTFTTLAPICVVVAMGCAPAYYNKAECDVACEYCVPAPLPHTHFDGCACHSAAALPHLSTSYLTESEQ